MRFYIVRHAQAKSKEEDPERPLTEIGRQEIKQTGSLAAEREMKNVTKIFHSGKARAKETAELLAEHTNPDIKPEEAQGLQPKDDPKHWVDRLKNGEFAGDVAVVGHLPHVARLATHLLCKNADEDFFDPHGASIFCLEQDEDKKWLLKWMITPETT
ncbi:MAG: phosphohistidine phosphatase SixA [candidate division Zixibacteria bacterium]|nr:phosphohistidine phosphatase SixA [candidate division Zixibacteria bacterium]NIR63292.1 phosphohistidine phosphatase SixA [candidate division Zixibacteria bacterium]NIS17280.1 phosphohistidine phosphatase SixA [candidate division Zixibacteria bacterium]NIS45278.1 phosphohistidine phosphatase SixA [candidate division Zixibacteria bacterium]NIU13418.1 phosphohistidine phosphatase SixA [candidate division Zixibacteria bacterium]